MKMYKVKVEIDTGYEYVEQNCVLFAENEEYAEKNASIYFNGRLSGEKFANVKNVTEITTVNGIIYQDYFEFD